MNILEELYKYQDCKYAEFIARLTPTVDPASIIGVRVPQLRKLAKEFSKEAEVAAFLEALPHKYYEEDLLHALIISLNKDYASTIKELNDFLPFIDNWAVCDILSLASFKKRPATLLEDIKNWICDEGCYTCRFGIRMLMNYYLDDDFKKEYHDLVAKVKSEEYYVQMMIAWYFATALAKQWDATLPYLDRGILDPWVRNKTIQKACESFRISLNNKEFLRALK